VNVLDEKQMQVLLIQPAHYTFVRVFRRVWMNPLTIAAVAACLPPDANAVVIDENVEPIDFEAPVDLVCITAMTTTAPRAYEIADEFRRRGVPVLLGGVHPSLMPDEAILHADAIVIGEAENILPRVVDDVRQGKMSGIYKAPDRPDLGGLGIARRDLLKQRAYWNLVKVETSRGCPMDCSFCSANAFFGRKVRYRPVAEVVAEIRDLEPKYVMFTDNNITANKRYAKELFRALIPLNIYWGGQASVNFVRDPEMLRLIKDSGCAAICIGFESLNGTILNDMGKVTNNEDEYARAIKELHRHQIGVIGCFILGCDGEGDDVFKDITHFMNDNRIDMPQPMLLTPQVGTRAREEMKQAGRVLHDDWSLYDMLTVAFRPERDTPAEYRRKYDAFAMRETSWPSTIRRFFRSILSLRSFHRARLCLIYNIMSRRVYRVSAMEQSRADLQQY